MSSNAELTIVEIETAMGVPSGTLIFGEHNEAKRTTPSSIAFRLPVIETRATERQEDQTASTVAKTSVFVFPVVIWAAGTKPGVSPVVTDLEAFELLYHALVAALCNHLGWQAFELGKGTPYREAKHGNLGIAYLFQLGIKFPVYSEQLSRHATLQTLLTVQISDALGANPEALNPVSP